MANLCIYCEKDIVDTTKNQNRKYCSKCKPYRRYRYTHPAIKIEDIKEAIKQKECQICGVADKPLDLDHCHKTNKVRGMLCRLCNRGLGHFHDDIGKISKAIEYLKRDIE